MKEFKIVEQLKSRESSIAIVGLGYVGLPLAVAFDKYFNVIGFDLNEEKLNEYRKGIDPTNEVGNEGIKACNIKFTSDPRDIKNAKFVIVAVPTPIRSDKTADLDPVINASRLIGENISEGAIVVFESTVYPGVTEDICAKKIEEVSGLTLGEDFYIGYSPERINPGDKVHTLTNIVKIVSGMNKEVRDEIGKVYGIIINESTGGDIYFAESIRVAEAAKLSENTQRDVNIALMNEFAMAFHHMGICTADVIKAMNTKWNALGFMPGFVGGHCIGVDPYYFIQEAEEKGYHSSLVSIGRRINNDMHEFVAKEIVKQLLIHSKGTTDWKVIILGMTFKGNCPDLRNSKAGELKTALEGYGLSVEVCDPVADENDIICEFGTSPINLEDIKDADCLIIAADHREFKELGFFGLKNMLSEEGTKLVIDVRNIFNREEIEAEGLNYWSL